MINESYIEVMVQRKSSPLVRAGIVIMGGLTGISVLGVIIGLWPALILAIIFGLASYLLSLYSAIEYEYTYVDKELQIDRILGKSRRKRMETLDLTQMEIMAPVGSHQLDGFKGKNQKVTDYSTGEKKQPEARYLLCMNDRQLIFEPGEALVSMIRNVAPRKVFTW
ncbi:MAG: DUF6106 family protein [Lachnospiraceae bacterium]